MRLFIARSRTPASAGRVGLPKGKAGKCALGEGQNPLRLALELAPAKAGGKAGGKGREAPLSIVAQRAYINGCRATGYDDKSWREIGTADPGAVPGGSTTSFAAMQGG